MAALDFHSLIRFFARFDRSDPMEHHEWIQFADSLTIPAFIVWLGGDVARCLLIREARRVPLARVIVTVEQGPAYPVQVQAERFLRKQYGLFRCENRVITVFRHVVRHKLLTS